MSRISRRQANAESSISVIQVGANTIFKPAGSVNLLPLVRTAVTLSHQILVEGHMLATLHILRLLGSNQPLPPLSTGANESKWQTMMDNCYAAVSQAVGPRCQQFSATKEPELATSYALYQRSLPAGHVKPTRPTWLKPVSLSWHSKFSSAAICLGPTSFLLLQYAHTSQSVFVHLWNESCTHTHAACTTGMCMHIQCILSAHGSQCDMWQSM